MPHDLPKWQTVFGYFRQWTKTGVWERNHASLHRAVRVAEGNAPEPTAVIIDNQSRKTTDKGEVHGYDVGKIINGRKRHIAVDTLGLLLALVVHSAAIQDREGAKLLFLKTAVLFPTNSLVRADGGYADN